MKQGKFTYLIASALLTFSIGNSSVIYADDTEIYLNSSNSDGAANLLFNLDTSGSMGAPVDENNNGVIDPGERSRIDVLKDAMGTVLDSLPSINAGLMRHQYYGGPILYPVAALDSEACGIEGNCSVGGAVAGVQTVTTLLASDDDDAEQTGALTVTLNRSALDFGERPAGTCQTNTGSVRVSSGTDDAESGAFFSTGSPDLEIPRDGANQQTVGVRFQSVPIPAGVTITDARLEFEIDSTSGSGYSAPIDVIITGESMAGTRATFDSTNQPSNRLATNPTTNTVNWETGEFPAVDEKLTTPNISAILNELVTNAAWPAAGGADVVLILKQDAAAAASATGSREVEAFEGEAVSAPLLTFSYSKCSGTAATVRTGLRFDNVNIPQGANITSARIDFVATAPGAGDPDLYVQMEDVDDAAAFITASPFASRTFIGGAVKGKDWNTGSSPMLANPWVVDTTYATPSLVDQVQTVVSRAGWCGGNAMMFMIERTGGDTAFRTAYSREGDSSKAPQLVVTYDADNPKPGATGCTRTTIVSLINSGSNDAEEHADGTMDISSTDLELVQDADTQQVGLRFTDIPVASGTVVTSAKLVFTTDEIDSGATSLTIHGQLTDDANPFSTAVNDISDTSERPRTSTSVTWTPPAFVNIGQTHEVTGLEGIVQEIVNQGGWASGNALAFLISGSGKRVVDSYDGSPATAPRLVMTFEGTPATSKKTVRQRLKDIAAGLNLRGGTPLAGTMLEAAYYFRGEPARFGRQRGDQSNEDKTSRISHAASYAA
ncbi:MAG: hypothetical protein ACU85U_03225, partial [Gammaproteobacteria bacterium]